MRISNNMITDNAVRRLAEALERQSNLQDRIASTKQFDVASDAPANASMALSLRSSLTLSQAYLETAQNTSNWMNASETSFKQMVTLATRAIKLVTNGLSDTNGDQQREADATEMGLIFNEAVDLGNTSHLGNYIFSGFHITTKPFSVAGDGTVTYNGDHGQMEREVAPGQTVVANVNGEDAFMSFFTALKTAQTALSSEDRTQMGAALSALNTAMDTINTHRASNGTYMRTVQSSIDHTETTDLEIKSLLSQREDLNMIEAISMLRSQETTYQAALEVAQRAMSSLNLFDVLR
jgi:flagellar hook-associated protein 3 FlgL